MMTATPRGDLHWQHVSAKKDSHGCISGSLPYGVRSNPPQDERRATRNNTRWWGPEQRRIGTEILAGAVASIQSNGGQ